MNKRSGARNGKFSPRTKVSPARRRGGWRVGEWHGRAKWSDEKVRALRADYERGVPGKGILATARKHGVPYSTAKNILQYETRASA